MPKTPMDYSKCCIYKIEHVDDDTLVYVGHTTNFEKRKIKHKSSCKNDNDKHYNLKVYQMIRQNGGWEKFLMLEVEKYPCNDKREAERRENEVMKEVRASMNTYNSFRTQAEITEYNTNYYELHKEKLKEQVKEYQKNNQLKMKEYQKNNKHKIQERMKEYQKNNKLKIQEQKKEYRENNKPKLNAKVKCECGCEIVKQNLKKHQARKKHLDKMKNI